MLLKGATYDLNSGKIYPAKSGSLMKKRTNREAQRLNSKSLLFSKLDELNQVNDWFMNYYQKANHF